MKLLRKTVIVVLMISILIILLLPNRTPKIEGENSVAIIEKIKLGGLEQAILVRGKDISNPVLLFCMEDLVILRYHLLVNMKKS
ncbi:hypothetical protein ACF3M2_20560 [Tissierella carlieri]|uniref:hypothetical protein n=1 Tax=Tissierella carlieri TaxID=689904 RepID=UPI00386A6772